MLDISKFSSRYVVRILGKAEVDEVLELCQGNTQYYEYCGAQSSREQIVTDMTMTPPGIDPSCKYYVGFYRERALMAVMDLIDGYPEPEIAFIGFFMMNRQFQGRQIGTAVIHELTGYLKSTGKTALRLAIDKGNPQSTHFWSKNGFSVIREVERDGGTLLVAEKTLQPV